MIKNNYHELIISEYYNELYEFYDNIFKNKDKYPCVAFTERSAKLSEIFYNILKEEGKIDGNEEFPINFITTNSLSNLINKIVKFYIVNKRFPKILIVTDLIVYGKTINNILNKLENEIIEKINPPENEKDLIIKALNSKIDIQAFIRNESPLLIDSRYLSNLKSNQILPPSKWRDYLNIIYFSLASNGKTNPLYIGEAITNNLNLNYDKLKNKGFSNIKIDYNNNSQLLFYKNMKLQNGQSIIYTIRIYKLNNKTYSISPFIFLPDINVKTFENNILKTFETKLNFKELNNYINKTELFILILNYSLLHEFIKISNIKVEFTSEITLKMNYNILSSTNMEQILMDITNLNKPILTLEQMDELFKSNTTYFEINKNNQYYENIQKLIEDEIYKIKLENHAHSHLSTQVWTEKREDKDIKFVDILKKYGENEEVISIILHLIDEGMIEIETYKESQEHLETILKPTEQALIIRPRETRKFIKGLLLVEKKSLCLVRDFDKELDNFININKISLEEIKEIKEFLNELKISGQKLEDWNFYFSIISPGDNWEKQMLEQLKIIKTENKYVDNYLKLIK